MTKALDDTVESTLMILDRTAPPTARCLVTVWGLVLAMDPHLTTFNKGVIMTPPFFDRCAFRLMRMMVDPVRENESTSIDCELNDIKNTVAIATRRWAALFRLHRVIL
jgi:hypothetical protein